jgi:hypothetical protein
MAITLTLINKAYLGAGAVMNIFSLTATGAGDTLSVGVTGGTPYKAEFMDANANQIITSPPTFGTWTTSGGLSTSTLTANAGGVVTNGRMIVFSGGV